MGASQESRGRSSMFKKNSRCRGARCRVRSGVCRRRRQHGQRRCTARHQGHWPGESQGHSRRARRARPVQGPRRSRQAREGHGRPYGRAAAGRRSERRAIHTGYRLANRRGCTGARYAGRRHAKTRACHPGEEIGATRGIPFQVTSPACTSPPSCTRPERVSGPRRNTLLQPSFR